MLMGVGNLTELTDADTTGITMLLMGIVSELAIRNVLVVQVSPHCRGAVREAEVARRILFAARGDGTPAPGLSTRACWPARPPPLPDIAGGDRRPAPVTCATPTSASRLAEDGLHVYNRDGHHVATDPFDLFPRLGVEHDAAHAFYLGVELARARDRLAARQALRAGRTVGLGLRRRPPGRTQHQLRRPGSHARPRRPPARLMPFIRESIVTTRNADGTAHIAPLGVIERGAAGW